MNRCYVGIDVGGTNTKIAILGEEMNCFSERIIPTVFGALEDFSESVIASIEDSLDGREETISAIGMGIPGLVDSYAGKSIFLPLHHWDGVNPCKLIAEHFNTSSVIDNDANINALGEYYFGDSRQYRNIIYITVGTGLGGAAICDGRLLRGRNNAAMEIGHMTVMAEGGINCVCGSSGCVEPYSSGTAMLHLAKKSAARYPQSLLAKLLSENNDNTAVSMAAESGDFAALEVICEIARYLGIAIADLCKLFNPDVVFVGGGVANAGDVLLDPVREEVKKRIMHPVQLCPIIRPSLKMKSGMYGAAALAALSVGADVDMLLRHSLAF